MLRAAVGAPWAALEDGLTVSQLLGRRYGRTVLTTRLRQVAAPTGLLEWVVGDLSEAQAQALALAYRAASEQAKQRRLWAEVTAALTRRRPAVRSASFRGKTPGRR